MAEAQKWLRVLVRPSTDGVPRAVVCDDGVWCDGSTMPFDAYRQRYKDKRRREAVVFGVTLADLEEVARGNGNYR